MWIVHFMYVAQFLINIADPAPSPVTDISPATRL